MGSWPIPLPQDVARLQLLRYDAAEMPVLCDLFYLRVY